jgi:YfiH family protein
MFASLARIPGLRHALSTREGGVSHGPYATLNLGYHVGDDPAAVSDNRRRLALAAGYPAAHLITGQQVHGARVSWVTAADYGRGAFSWDDAVAETDGLLTADAGVPIAVLVADCAPVLIVEPRQRLLAVVHAGWKGALARIASAAVYAMRGVGGDPAACRAVVGPTLCPECLEVGDEVAARVTSVFPSGVLPRPGARPHLEIRRMIVDDLAGAGVPASAVACHPACPRCQPERFFSYRAAGGTTGRFALLAWWE